MVSISDLKKKREEKFKNLIDKMEKMNKSSYSNPEDDKFWRCKTNEAGSGFAVIRFLPAPPGEDDDYVRIWNHSFQDPKTGKWYIENCLSTIGKDDPVLKYNNILWNTGDEEKRKQVSRQKRKLSYISNILVVKDPANPENEGKVFLFRYGQKIFEKLNDATKETFEGDTKFNPFDFWEGANFNLVIERVAKWPNYDKSKFSPQSPVAESDEEIEKIWKQEHSLKELIADDKFKSYEELEKRLFEVLGVGKSASDVGPVATAAETPSSDFATMLDNAQKEKEASSTIDDEIPFLSDDKADEDDDLAAFLKMASE